METRTAPQVLLLPVRPGFIVATLAAALALNLLPWSGTWVLVKPDFVALALLYWCVNQPRRVGFLVAFLLGLAMDVADGTLMGQHALAYTLLAFASIVLHRRIQRFAMKFQVLHVVALLLLTNVVVLLVRALAGSEFPGALYFAGAFSGAALWPAVSHYFKLPQRPRLDPDQI
jgi:rod shape-determining protein MreD